MHKKILIQFVVLFTLTCTLAHAEIGNLKEVIKDAEENRKPTYLTGLMRLYSSTLSDLATQKNLNTPQKKLAWFLTMRGIFKLIYATTNDAASAAAGDCIYTIFYDQAKANGEDPDEVSALARETAKAAVNGTHNLDWLSATAAVSLAGNEWEDVYDSEKIWRSASKAYYAAKKNAFNAARGVARAEVDAIAVASRVAWRVSEWTVWNHFYTNLNSFVDTIFSDVLAELHDDLSNNPFAKPKSAADFYDEHFGHLSKGSKSFLDPWLVFF